MQRILLVFILALLATVAQADIVINEIMYNSSFDPDVEYIELYNAGTAAVNLLDWYLLDDNPSHTPCYLSGILAPGEYLVVAAETDIFAAQFPEVANLYPLGFDTNGEGFGLGNGGDAVVLYDDDEEVVDIVEYDDGSPWPGSPDGEGPSLELINPGMDNNLPSSWDPSVEVGGTPGAVNSSYAADGDPICRDGARDIALPTAADEVTITVRAYDDGGAPTVELFVDSGDGFTATAMFDDGLHGDGAAADSTFGAVIAAQTDGTVVRYYVKATDGLGQIDFWPGDAPAEYRAYTVGWTAPAVGVNEIIASNEMGDVDEAGEHEDWVELHNAGTGAVDLGGMFLTDDFNNPDKWAIPAGTIIPAGGFLRFWADEDLEQGPLHADLKLSADGEEIALFSSRDQGNTMISGWKFGPCQADMPVGYRRDYMPQADDAPARFFPEYLTAATPGATNSTAAYYSDVCINEFHSTSAGGGVDDWIELYNRGDASVDVSGAHLSDRRSDLIQFAIPEGTIVPAGGYLVFDETVMGFGWSSAGDDVIVFAAADSVTGLDFYDFGPQTPDVSEGRAGDGFDAWAFFPAPTPGQPNSGASAVDEPNLPGPALGPVQAYPNPFNPRTKIAFTLNARAEVTVEIIDVAGRRVRTLAQGALEAGPQTVIWDGEMADGRRAASGTYFARVLADRDISIGRMVLVK